MGALVGGGVGSCLMTGLLAGAGGSGSLGGCGAGGCGSAAGALGGGGGSCFGDGGSGGGLGIDFFLSSLSLSSSCTRAASAANLSCSFFSNSSIRFRSASSSWRLKTRIAASRTRSCSTCAAARASRWLSSVLRSSERKRDSNPRSGLERIWLRRADGDRVMFVVFSGTDSGAVRRSAAPRGCGKGANRIDDTIEESFGWASALIGKSFAGFFEIRSLSSKLEGLDTWRTHRRTLEQWVSSTDQSKSPS